MVDSTGRASLEIIRATQDGSALAPQHLKLVELAINGFLNEDGEKAFQQLHADVLAGTYRWPWFKGIENLLLDHVGYVRWKGQIVEHFELAYAYSDESTAYAREIARRCAVLDAHGITPSTHAVVWWDKTIQLLPREIQEVEQSNPFSE
jgi:hypothetical protein